MPYTRYIVFLWGLLLAPWISASPNNTGTSPSCVLYQQGNVQLNNDVQLLLYGGSWITHGNITGNGQLVISHSPHATIDGNGATIQNLRLQHSNITLLSTLYIAATLQLTDSAQLQLISYPLYLLPDANLVSREGSDIHGCGTAQLIRLSRLSGQPEAPSTPSCKVMPAEPTGLPCTPQPQPATIDCFWPPAIRIVSITVAPTVPPPKHDGCLKWG